MNAVANVRNEAKAEIEKMRDKIQEVRTKPRIDSQKKDCSLRRRPMIFISFR